MRAVTHVLILEDQLATSQWLRGVVAAHLPAARVDACYRLAEAKAWLARQPDGHEPLCLVDLALPDGSGVEFIAALTRRLPSARAVVTTLFDDDNAVLRAMAAGAAGYILKDQDPEVVGDRIAAIERGEVPMSPAISRRILELFRINATFQIAASTAELTPRENDVLRMVGRGLRVSEVAASLGLSSQTVAGYLKTIYRKLDINTRAEATLEAARRGLV